MQLDAQQRQKLILTSEIRMLEKQKRDTEFSLEQLSSTRKEEFTQYTKQIKELQLRRNELSEQVERLRSDLELLTNTYNTARRSIEELQEAKLKDANKEAEAIVANAKKIEITTVEKHDAAQILLEDNKLKVIELAKKEKDLQAIRELYHQKSDALEVQKKEAAKILNEITDDVEVLKDIKKTIHEEINQLRLEKDTIEKEIALERQNHAIAEHALEEKERKIQVLLKTNEQKEKILLSEKAYMKQQQRLIDDRRASLDRAVEEMRNKGAKI